MRALFLLALFIVGPGRVLVGATQDAPADIRTYVASNEDFPNPERGFHKVVAPMFLGTARQPLDAAYLATLRQQGMSTIRAYFVIDEFRGAPLTSAALAMIAADFAAVRVAGLKIIPRFAYDYPCATANEPCNPDSAVDAPLSRVVEHIAQLAPLLQANADVIAFMDMGFVGAWGEWHQSSNLLVNADRTVNASSATIVDRVLAALPARRMVTLRYPYHKQALLGAAPLSPGEAFTMTPRARVGAHNDCFLAGPSDGGTYTDPYPPFAEDPERFKQYLGADNRYLPQGGETCSSAPAAQPFISCTNALSDLARMHWSTLAGDYQPDVIALWRTQGCLGEISRRLGYRFRLVGSDLPNRIAIGDALTARFSVANDGWSVPYNPRAVELILRNVANGRVYRLPTDADPRRWASGTSTLVAVSTGVPEAVEPGTYRLLLALPDPEPTLHARPEYSIRLANAGLWEPATGFNDLQAEIEVVDNRAPRDFEVLSVTGNIVAMRWAPTSPAPDGYVLEGGPTPGSILGRLPIAGSGTTASMAIPTGAFYLRLRAVRAGTMSGASNEVRAFVNVPLPPAAPANLLATVNGAAVQLAWQNPASGGPASSLWLDVSGTLTAAIPLGVVNNVLVGGVPAGNYSVALRASNASGSSAASPSVALSVPGPCSGVPGTPTAFAVDRQGNYVSVSWELPVSGAAPAGYTLFVQGPLSGALPLATRGIAAAVPSGTYTLSVTAVNACGTSVATPARSVTVP